MILEAFIVPICLIISLAFYAFFAWIVNLIMEKIAYGFHPENEINRKLDEKEQNIEI